ncbi:hypothetical protein SAMN05216229_102110 [Geopseudomonas sagittaria]|uniref:Uncharacterized protein n=1 Tax=Geopseudomonas sagittaria TaxID=1135990 RepID=A0A1I5Q0B4_9GAMM|nr:hypothetical protein SAMN05216229_102110 [Pseudomonas sagittaria]
MPKQTPIALLLISLLLASGCASESIRPVAQDCPPPPAPPAWMMAREPEQTYTQQMQRLLSE